MTATVEVTGDDSDEHQLDEMQMMSRPPVVRTRHVLAPAGRACIMWLRFSGLDPKLPNPKL